MKAYVLCTIVGTGIDSDFFRPKVDDYGVNWAVAIAPDQQTNPNKQWVLCVVAGDQTVIDSMSTDSGITILPFSPADLDTLWLNLGTRNERNNLANAIKQRTGVTVETNDPRTLREIITEIGQTLSATFDPNNLDIRDGTGII